MPVCPRCQSQLPAQGMTCPRCGADVQWWSSREGQVYGPYDLATIQFCRQDGRVVDDDFVKVGEGPWLPAREVFPLTSPGAPAGQFAPQTPLTPAPIATGAPAARPKTSTGVYWAVGIIVVIFGMMMVGIMAAILFPVFARARDKAQQVSCQANLKQLAVAAQMYAADNAQRFPAATDWKAPLQPYLRKETSQLPLWSCPGCSPARPYSLNASLAGTKLPAPKETPRPLAWCPSLTGSNPPRGPHSGQYNLVTSDGVVKPVGTEPQQGK